MKAFEAEYYKLSIIVGKVGSRNERAPDEAFFAEPYNLDTVVEKIRECIGAHLAVPCKH